MKQKKLIEIRKKFGYNQYEMAQKLNITQSYYCQIELGQKKLYYDFAIKISQIFNKRPDDIFYPEKEKKES